VWRDAWSRRSSLRPVERLLLRTLLIYGTSTTRGSGARPAQSTRRMGTFGRKGDYITSDGRSGWRAKNCAIKRSSSPTARGGTAYRRCAIQVGQPDHRLDRAFRGQKFEWSTIR
jgi:hypothetical protein